MPVPTAGVHEVGADRRDRRRTFHALYDFTRDGGAVGAITLKDERGQTLYLPDNFVVERTTIETLTAFTSSGAATIALGSSEASKGAVVLAATGYGSAPFNAADAVAAGAAALPYKVTGTGKTATLTVAGADLTAGKALITYHGYQGD